MKSYLRFMLGFVAVFALVTAAYAGGWAIITVNQLPEYAVAGQPLTLTFSVRQHGKTLLSELHPTIQTAAPGGRTIKVAAMRTASPGEYSARLTAPEPGEWKITIVSGFNTSSATEGRGTWQPSAATIFACNSRRPPFRIQRLCRMPSAH